MRQSHASVFMGLTALGLCTILFLGGCPDGSTDTGGDSLYNLQPTVVLTSDVTLGVAPLLVRFDSSASTDDGVIVTRLWTFGDGGSSADIAPTHTYTSTGTYTVTLKLTDDDGASASKTTTINVTERPIAVIDVDSTTADTAPATFTFDASSSYDPDAETGDTLTVLWDFDDGARETLATVDHTFVRPGTYRVTLKVTDATGVSGTAYVLIQVGIPQPTAEFLAPGDEFENLVFTPASTLWLHARFNVEQGVPYTRRAGLDGDRDACDAVTVLINPTSGSITDRLLGHAEPVLTAAFSSDGVLVASGSADETIRIYDAATGRFLRESTPAAGAINALAFSPDGTQIIAGTETGKLELISAADGSVIRDDFAGHAGAVHDVKFSPAGDRVASASEDGDAILWDIATANEIIRLSHTADSVAQPVYAIAFNPTSLDELATGAADNRARLWNTATGDIVRQFAPVFDGGTQVAGHLAAVRAIAFASDGLTLLTGGADGTARIWNVATGDEVRVFAAQTDAVTAVAFSPDDSQVMTGNAAGVGTILEVATGNLIRELTPCTSAIGAVQFSPADDLVLMAVAAYNAILLDASPTQGNDQTLTLPTAFQLDNVPAEVGGRLYWLWIEVDTDRTEPSRSYASPDIWMVPAFSTVADPNGLVPLGEADAATIVPAPLTRNDSPPRRQVFDLGPVAAGDQLETNLVSFPGGQIGDDEPGYSIIMLDGQQTLFAWFQSGVTQLPNQPMLIGHSSDHFYIGVDNNGNGIVPALQVKLTRGFSDGRAPRNQLIFLDYRGVTGYKVDIGAIPVDLAEYEAAAEIKESVLKRLATVFAAYDVTVTTSDDSDEPTDPHITIYFDDTDTVIDDAYVDSTSLYQGGRPSYIDARDATHGGDAVIVISALGFTGDNTANGVRLANSIAHQTGLLWGLRPTSGSITDIMGFASTLASETLKFDPPAPYPSMRSKSGISPIGRQDADTYIQELIGVAP